jgi:hypothetical protein
MTTATKRIEAAKIGSARDGSEDCYVTFNVPAYATADMIWTLAKAEMRATFGHRNVTCWKITIKG